MGALRFLDFFDPRRFGVNLHLGVAFLIAIACSHGLDFLMGLAAHSRSFRALPMFGIALFLAAARAFVFILLAHVIRYLIVMVFSWGVLSALLSTASAAITGLMYGSKLTEALSPENLAVTFLGALLTNTLWLLALPAGVRLFGWKRWVLMTSSLLGGIFVIVLGNVIMVVLNPGAHIYFAFIGQGVIASLAQGAAIWWGVKEHLLSRGFVIDGRNVVSTIAPQQGIEAAPERPATKAPQTAPPSQPAPKPVPAERQAPAPPPPRRSRFRRFMGSGVCDVCSRPISSGEAYAVPLHVFYGSAAYRNFMRNHPMVLMLGGDVDAYLAQMRAMDKSEGSAVCEGCIHMFE
ncbi:MAG: hypothetical protein MUF51_06670 [Vicinamibacteria bacterium]|jgi:hypothetical protein|nr:hypothetical protein [Vicinamibacteria bacterium]